MSYPHVPKEKVFHFLIIQGEIIEMNIKILSSIYAFQILYTFYNV